MNFNSSLLESADWQQQAYQYLVQGEYQQAASFYEQAIEVFPTELSHYWYLGLILLLQGQEAEAQATWMLGMAQGEPDEVDQPLVELFEILQTEAERREAISDYPVAWAIRQHMREVIPRDINNLLHLIRLSIEIQSFTGEELVELGLIEALQFGQPGEVDPNLLLGVLQKVLETNPEAAEVREFAEACLPYVETPQRLIDVLMIAAIKIGYALNRPRLASQLAELCLAIDADNPQVLIHLSAFYRQERRYLESIEVAKHYYDSCQTREDQIFANYLVLKALINAGGYWQEAREVFQNQKKLIQSLTEIAPADFNPTFASQLLASTSIFYYLVDNPKSNRLLQNKLASLCQYSIQNYANYQERGERRLKAVSQSNKKLSKIIKVGYISSCLQRHSVGWLSRWLFQYYNRDNFQVYAYFINQPYATEFTQDWFVKNSSFSRNLGFKSLEIFETIAKDEIDILVDLDSMTLDVTCEVMALKPAPIQVTWLGFDASGLPAIDYFIADPYVLPEDAQDYYTEKIWRLPQTYVAVDGFEVGVPTLRREDLEIPNDGIVYFSAQNAHKRNLEMARLQMKILKEVPNSYFLIKGSADRDILQNLFAQIAAEEGVEENRLRFLPEVASEEVHRANLGIADVVLDTYPYNGATTTLETLWMGIPLVTRVGEQFSSRNSYTMMMNAGISEGLAWTDEAYVEWGVRLGQDAALRQQIAWRLWQSRQTSPLWNAKQFTREMEKAYQAMWLRYVESI